jgi:hypothetical protein
MIYDHLLIPSIDGTIRIITPSPEVAAEGMMKFCSVASSCTFCLIKVEHFVCYSEEAHETHSFLGQVSSLITRSGGQIFPSILGTSKLVYQEAMPILYFNNDLTLRLDGSTNAIPLLKALPVFPYHIPHLHLIIKPEAGINDVSRMNMLDAVSEFERIFNGHMPSMTSGHVYFRNGYTPSCSGLAHQLFHTLERMPAKPSLAYLNPAKRDAVLNAAHSRSTDVAASDILNATLQKAVLRRKRRCTDTLRRTLTDTLLFRQRLYGELAPSSMEKQIAIRTGEVERLNLWALPRRMAE